MKNKILIILPIFLLLFTSFALAGIDKLPVYNPFGRHLQYLATGFNNATTQDLILESTGVSTTLVGTINSSVLELIIAGNKTTTQFPSKGILIINNEALVYANMTLENVTNATVYLDKRGAYGTTATSHSSGVTVYFTKFLVGTNDSTTPFFVINTDGNIGVNKMVPIQLFDIVGNVSVSEIVNADTLNTTNLKAENLEQNLDGTDFNITADTGFMEINWSYITSKFITAVDNIYIYMSGTTATLNETKLNETIGAYNDSMKTYVDAQDTVFNDSMKTYADAQDVIYNDSMKTYVDTLNDSMVSYIDTQDSTYNTSMKTYVDGIFITQANEGNLDVNSSNHLNLFNTTTLENDDDDKLTVKQSWLETLFYTIAQIEGFNISLYGIFYTQTEVEVINSSAVKVGENISSNYITDTPAACSANSAMIQHGPSNFSTSVCADYWLNSAGNEIVTNEVNFTGNVTSNRYYAEIWFHNDTGDGEITIITTQGEYTNLTGFNSSDTAGQKLNGFSWNNGTEDLTANVAGLYDVTFDISAGNSGVNQHMQFQIQVNGVLQENSDAHRKIGTGGDVGNCGDTAYIDLDVGDVIELVVRNNDGTTDLESFAASVNILRIAD